MNSILGDKHSGGGRNTPKSLYTTGNNGDKRRPADGPLADVEPQKQSWDFTKSPWFLPQAGQFPCSIYFPWLKNIISVLSEEGNKLWQPSCTVGSSVASWIRSISLRRVGRTKSQIPNVNVTRPSNLGSKATSGLNGEMNIFAITSCFLY